MRAHRDFFGPLAVPDCVLEDGLEHELIHVVRQLMEPALRIKTAEEDWGKQAASVLHQTFIPARHEADEQW